MIDIEEYFGDIKVDLSDVDLNNLNHESSDTFLKRNFHPLVRKSNKVNILNRLIDLREENLNNEEYKNSRFLLSIMIEIFYSLGIFTDRINNKQTDFEKENNHFTFIPSSYFDFDTDIRSILKKEEKSSKDLNFIDVGSGTGGKVFWADKVLRFKSSTGIEYNKDTYGYAKTIFDIYYDSNAFRPKYEKIKFINGDAFKHNYGEYDFIYMYMPIKMTDKLFKLYDHIISTMKNGAILFDIASWTIESYSRIYKIPKPLKNENYVLNTCYLKKIDDQVYFSFTI